MAKIIIEFSDNYLEERVNAQQAALLKGSKEDMLKNLFDTTLMIGTKHELVKSNNEVVIKMSDIESLECDEQIYNIIQDRLTSLLGLPALIGTAKDKNIKTNEK